ncbi:MAG: hypothetical protein R3A45_08765 [Bdellovibrionota bacterium]
MKLAYSANPKEKNNEKFTGKASQPRILVPDGKYTAMAIKCKVFKMFGGLKALIEFKLEGYDENPSEYNSIYLVIQMHKVYGYRSKMYRLWSLIHQRIPQKGEKISPHDFVGHIYEITTRTVTNDERQKDHLSFMRYSVVDSILSVLVWNHINKNTPNVKPVT